MELSREYLLNLNTAKKKCVKDDHNYLSVPFTALPRTCFCLIIVQAWGESSSMFLDSNIA